jgi:hypothetical protein
MTRAALLERLECERVAPPPRPHYNPVRHYEVDIAARRLEAGYAAEVAVRRGEASQAAELENA